MKRIFIKAFVLLTILTAAVFAAATGVFAATLNDVIKSAIDSKTTSINVEELGLTPDEAVDGFYAVLDANPNYYFVSDNVKVTSSGNTAKTLTVTYAAADSNSLDAAVDAIVAQANALSTAYDKAKFVHDYLAGNTSYDNTHTKFTAYDALVGKSAVCEGYANAYKLVMNKLGIECEYATSKDMQHMWNIVKIDGQWYNVDCTWDSTTKTGAAVPSTYFMKSTSHFAALGYYGATENAACASTTYDAN